MLCSSGFRFQVFGVAVRYIARYTHLAIHTCMLLLLNGAITLADTGCIGASRYASGGVFLFIGCPDNRRSCPYPDVVLNTHRLIHCVNDSLLTVKLF